MKKTFIILASVVLAAAACMKFEPEVVTPRVYTDAPTFSNVEVKDSSVAVTITPSTGTGYYSYAFVKGKAQALDSMKVFKVSVSGAIKAGTCKAAETTSMPLSVKGLTPNTDYTVYAVSSSTQGSVGKVVSQTFHTSDIVAPFIVKMASADTTLTIQYSEAVTIANDAKFEVRYFAVNKGLKEDQPIATVTAKAKMKDASTAVFECGPMPAGAYYTLAYAEGTFVDAVGNKCAALPHNPFTVSDKGKVSNTKANSGKKANKEFELSIYGGKPVQVVTSMQDYIWISVPEDFVFYKNYASTAKGSISYIYTEDGGVKTATYETGITSISKVQGHVDFGWNSSYNCALAIPNYPAYSGRPDPIRGAYVLMSIPSYLEDIYGNMNAEFTIGPFLYSYGYSLDDVIGTYNCAATSYFSGDTTFPMVIEKSDNAQKGNVMITSIFNIPVSGEGCGLYATFDVDLGTLTIPDWQKLMYYEKYAGYIYFAINGADYEVLSMPSSGKLVSDGTWFGYYIDIDQGGWMDIYTTMTAEKAPAVAAAPTAARDFKVRYPSRIIK